MLKIDLDRIPGPHRTCDAIDGRDVIQLLLECPKQLIPEDENLAVVLIDVFWIDGMMDPMMGWRDDDMFQPPELADMLRVIPELRKEVKRCHRGNDGLRYTQDGRGQQEESEYPKEDRDALTKGTGQIILLTAVMDDVVVPEQIVLVSDAMGPVAGEIEYHEGDEIRPKSGIDPGNGQISDHPTVGKDDDGDAQHVLCHIGDA